MPAENGGHSFECYANSSKLWNFAVIGKEMRQSKTTDFKWLKRGFKTVNLVKLQVYRKYSLTAFDHQLPVEVSCFFSMALIFRTVDLSISV